MLLPTGDMPSRPAPRDRLAARRRAGHRGDRGRAVAHAAPAHGGIDILERVRADTAKRHKDNLYRADYEALIPFKELADRLDIAVVVIHHLSKRAKGDDLTDLISGTTGLAGAADTIIVLYRDSNGTKLYARGRDIEEVEIALHFDKKTGSFTVLGDAEDVRALRNPHQDHRRADGFVTPLGPKEIALCSGLSVDAVQARLTAHGPGRRHPQGRLRQISCSPLRHSANLRQEESHDGGVSQQRENPHFSARKRRWNNVCRWRTWRSGGVGFHNSVNSAAPHTFAKGTPSIHDGAIRCSVCRRPLTDPPTVRGASVRTAGRALASPISANGWRHIRVPGPCRPTVGTARAS